MNAVLREALRLHAAGHTVLPIKLNGTKAPDLWHWTKWKTERPRESDVRLWFRGPLVGMAVVGGVVSGGLSCLDFDNHGGRPEADVFRQWIDLVPRALLRKLVIYSTPKGGWRVAYRGPFQSRKGKIILARLPPLPGKVNGETIIEELSAGHLILCPGGHPDAHQLRKPYVYRRGHLAEVQPISGHEQCELLEAAYSFNRWTPPPKCPQKPLPASRIDLDDEDGPTAVVTGERPGDDFNARATWEEILEPLGWEICGHAGQATHWRRPDKSRGISATTNLHGFDRMYVFTSSTALEPGKWYDKWGVLAHLVFKGDFHQTAKELARQGYGGQSSLPKGNFDGMYTL